MRANVWIEAARPKTLPAALSPALLGLTLAYKSGHFEPLITLFMLIAALTLQIGANYVNDYFDFVRGADRPDRKGPRRAMSAGLTTAKEMKLAICITFLTSAFASIPLIAHAGWPIAIGMCLFILFAIGYTAGPFPLAYRGLGDLTVLLLFGPTATCYTYYLQTLTFSPRAAIAGLGCGSLATAILMVNNIRDVNEDRLSGKRTLPVRFGVRFAQVCFFFTFCLAAWIPLLFISENRWMLLPVLILPIGAPLFKKIFHFTDPHELNETLARTAKLLMLYTILFCAAWMI